MFRRTGDLWSLLETFEGEATIHAEPFDSVGLDMSRWWLTPKPSPQGS